MDETLRKHNFQFAISCLVIPVEFSRGTFPIFILCREDFSIEALSFILVKDLLKLPESSWLGACKCGNFMM